MFFSCDPDPDQALVGGFNFKGSYLKERNEGPLTPSQYLWITRKEQMVAGTDFRLEPVSLRR
jgi:hypothetical protein